MLTTKELQWLSYHLSLTWFQSQAERANQELVCAELTRVRPKLAPSFAAFVDVLLTDLRTNPCRIFRRDRHSWAVSIFVDSPANGLYMLDSTDWCFSIRSRAGTMSAGQDREAEYAEKLYQSVGASTSIVPPGELPTVHIVAKSNRFFDSLLFSFALDELIEAAIPGRWLDLVLVDSMHFRSFAGYAANPRVTKIVTVTATALHQMVARSPRDVWIQCLRFPADQWRSSYRRRFEAFVRSRRAQITTATLQPVFTVLISFELEKRRWLQQAEGLFRLLSALRVRHGDLRVLVNGLTAPVTGSLPPAFAPLQEEEAAMMAALQIRLGPQVAFASLYGLTLTAKIDAINGADFFVAPIGSASLVPAYLGIPGVIYGTAEFADDNAWLYDGLGAVRRFATAWVRPHQGDESIMKYDWARYDASSHSYSIEPDDFVAFVLDYAGEIDRHGSSQSAANDRSAAILVPQDLPPAAESVCYTPPSSDVAKDRVNAPRPEDK